jgi:hypothetical protein
MAEQNKEKERCSGSYRQAVGFLVIKIGTYEILFFLNLYSISHNSKVLSENKKRIPSRSQLITASKLMNKCPEL